MDWRVKFVDYPLQWRRQREDLLPVIEDTIARGDLMLRQQLHDFEDNLARFVGTVRAVGVSNCTDGLRLLAHALDVGPGDEIVRLEGQPLLSIADVQWVLHRADPEGASLKAEVRRDGRPVEVTLTLPKGWRRHDDLSWRASSWDANGSE